MDPDFEKDVISSTPKRISDKGEDILRFWIGVGLAVSSSIFIGASFVIKKKALIRLGSRGVRANEGGYGYLKDCLWWTGLISMGVGEGANFIAYAFAPASLVSTLGILSVLVSSVLSAKYLNEHLYFLGKLGCLLSALGATVIILHAPVEQPIQSMDELQSKMADPLFIIYVVSATALSIYLIYGLSPKYSVKSTISLLIWIGVCALIGSLSVMAIKGIGLALSNSLKGSNEFTKLITWVCIFGMTVCIAVQMNFLNKALDTFNTAVVTPIYYVAFTSCVIIASAILFKEFQHVMLEDWTGLFCGFSTVLVAITLLHVCKKFDFTFKQLTTNIQIVQLQTVLPEPLENDGEPDAAELSEIPHVRSTNAPGYFNSGSSTEAGLLPSGTSASAKLAVLHNYGSVKNNNEI